MYVKIEIEANGITTTHEAHDVAYLQEMLTLLLTATRGPFHYVEALAAEKSNGQMIFSDPE